MPTNVTKGDTAEFIAEFLDGANPPNIVIPAGATLEIDYPVGTTIASTLIAMVQSGSFFIATWASGVSDYGLANWSVTAVGATAAMATGTLNIIDP